MYNSIGLPTPRGSGTNAHVQRNLASIKPNKGKGKQTEESQAKPLILEPNEDILEHARKREIEIKCIELSDTLEEQGFTLQEIDVKVNAYRKALLENYEKSYKQNDVLDHQKIQDSHQRAKAQHERNVGLEEAFGSSTS